MADRHIALDDLNAEPVMAHLIGRLESGHSIGHYGRKVFAIYARHSLDPEELLEYLQKDPECDERQAKSLLEHLKAQGL